MNRFFLRLGNWEEDWGPGKSVKSDCKSVCSVNRMILVDCANSSWGVGFALISLMCSVVDGLPSTPSCRALLPADALHPDIGNGGDVAHCIGGMCESGGMGRSALMLAAGE